ncbi:MAG: 4Fe-4S dicluster domain-containing protein [Methanobacteriota archaeon]
MKNEDDGENTMKNVFVRQERCVGCKHCELACSVEHSESKDLFQSIHEDKSSLPRIHVETVDNYLTFPNRCRHCDPAPCMQVCPTGSLYRDEATGSVLVNYGKCIQCSVCAMACPFGIISFQQVHQIESSREVNAKCDNCISRLREGQIPACAQACKTGALEFGDINNLIRETRAEFTMRLIRSQGTEVKVPVMPDNIRAYKAVMESIANI